MNDQNQNTLPATGEPGDAPPVAALIAEFRRCSPWNANGWNRIANNDDVRFNRWAGKQPDCKKRASKTDRAFPWDGASDQENYTADDVINGIVAESFEAFWRAWLSPKAGGNQASNYAVKLADHIINTWLYEDLYREVELSEQYRQNYGWMALHPFWERRIALENRTVRLQDLLQVAQRLAAQLSQGGAELPPQAVALATLPEMILDPELEDAAAQTLQAAYQEYARAQIGEAIELPPLRLKRVRQAVRDLRRDGRAELPLPYICRDQPAICALKPWEDIFIPANCTDLQKATVVFQRDFLTEVDLRSRILLEEWDEKFVEEAIKHKGKYSSWSTAATPSRESFSNGITLASALAGAGAGSLWEESQQRDDLIEIVYATYRMLDADNVPGVYVTILHPSVGGSEVSGQKSEVSPRSTYAWSGLLDGARGEYPYITCQRENVARNITSSRGVPEICNSWQRIIKVQTDASIDWTSIGVLPPVNIPASGLKTEYEFGPARKNYVPLGREPRFMDVPSKGVPVVFEVGAQAEKAVDKYFGRENPELPPQDAHSRRQMSAGSFLMAWTKAIQKTVNLCQRHLPDARFAEITGAPPGWLDQNRDQTDLLSAKLQFDVRELNPEFVKATLEAVNEAVIPGDTAGITDRAKWTRVQWRMINPRLARELVSDEAPASQKMFEAVKTDIALMFLGNEPAFVEMDPAAPSKLQFASQIVAANPIYQQSLQQGGRFGELMQKWAMNLQFSITQEENKKVGRLGVQSELASA